MEPFEDENPFDTDAERIHSETSSTSKVDISAPASPGKLRTAREKERASPRSKRVSMDLSVDDTYGRSDDEDVTAAALAAVASSRRSPTAGKKGRQPLPREFRDRKISDEKVRIR